MGIMDTKEALAGVRFTRKRDGDFEVVTLRLPAFGASTAELDITGEQAEGAVEHWILSIAADFVHRVYADSSIAQRITSFAEQALAKVKGGKA